MPKNNYLSVISLNEFNQVLKLNDIHVDKNMQLKILHALRCNIFALVDDYYTCVLEEYLSSLTHEDPESIQGVCNYFKPLLT